MDNRTGGWLRGRVLYTITAAYYWAIWIYLDDLFASIGELPNGEWYEQKIGLSTYGGRYKFLTHWNLLLQRFYFSFACLAFLVKSNFLRSASRIIFGGLIIPGCIIVTLMFWVIYSIDRESIFPKFYDDIYPWWMNHCLHTFCSLIALADCLLVPNPVAVQQLKWERLCSVAFAVSYIGWMYWVKYEGGIWVYKFMYKLNNQQMVAFICINIVTFLLFQWLGVQLRKFKWGSVENRLQSEKSKSD